MDANIFFEAQGWVIYFPWGRKRNWDYCWGGTNKLNSILFNINFIFSQAC